MIEMLIRKIFLDDLKNIYKRLNDILYEYEASDMFYYLPGTKIKSDNHYEAEIMDIRKEVDCSFWYNNEARNSLYKIIDEVMYITAHSNDIPNVPARWLRANPRLQYFDAVYNVLEDDYEAYKKIKNKEMCFGFSFTPTLEEYMDRKNHFERKHKKYSDCNIDATEARLYQDELVDTLAIVFEAEMTEYVIDKKEK